LPKSSQIIRQIPRPYVKFRNKLVYYGEELLAPRLAPKLEDRPLSAVATAYSIYLQLLPKSGGRLLRLQPQDAPCRGDRGPHFIIPTLPAGLASDGPDLRQFLEYREINFLITLKIYTKLYFQLKNPTPHGRKDESVNQ